MRKGLIAEAQEESAVEWPATCNLKVKHRPSGSPITVYSLMGTLQTCILGAQQAPLFIPSLVLCHDVGNDCEHGSWPDHCVCSNVSELPFNPSETNTQNTSLGALWDLIVHFKSTENPAELVSSCCVSAFFYASVRIPKLSLHGDSIPCNGIT